MSEELKRKIKFAASALVMAVFSAAMNAMFTDTATQWYQGLKKSALEPPCLVYLILCEINYLLVVASLYFTLIKKRKQRVIYCFGAVLALLPLWNYIYFQKQNALSALILLLIILPAAVHTAIVSFKTSKTAGLLLVPMIAGLGFILLLNYTVYMLN